MKTVAQVVDGLNELFVSRNIEFLEYDFSREMEGRKVAFFNRLAFVSLEDIRHIANTVVLLRNGILQQIWKPMFLNWRTVTYIGLLPIKINCVSW